MAAILLLPLLLLKGDPQRQVALKAPQLLFRFDVVETWSLFHGVIFAGC